MNKRREGFTVAELLVTVAIIGILVAVSIPLFSWITENNKEKTDENYISAAKVAYLAAYAEEDPTDTTFQNTLQYYNPKSGGFETLKKDIQAYGQGTIAGNDPVSHVGKIIECTYAADGSVDAEWVSGPLDDSEQSGGNNPMLGVYTSSEFKEAIKSISTVWTSLNSTNISSSDTQKIQSTLTKLFPNTNIQAWRITNEKTAYTITITDVDISKLKNGDRVKVIRFNPNYYNKTTKTYVQTYTAAYVNVETVGTGSSAYNTLAIKTGLTGWKEISGQSADTKQTFKATVDIYNNAADSDAAGS